MTKEQFKEIKISLIDNIDRNIIVIKEWEEKYKDEDFFLFYNELIDYYFVKPGEVTRAFGNVIYCGDKLEFILGLESFLINVLLDDSNFDIMWKRYSINDGKFVKCHEKDIGYERLPRQ